VLDAKSRYVTLSHVISYVSQQSLGSHDRAQIIRKTVNREKTVIARSNA
jgi:hypothetical protein